MSVCFFKNKYFNTDLCKYLIKKMEAEFDKWLESDEHTECEEKLRKVNRSKINLKKVIREQNFKLERLGVQ